MFYTYSAVCICSYRTLAILENASPLVRPPTLRESAVYIITNSPNVVTPIWALPAAAETPK